MTLLRMDNVAIVVVDLDAAIAFFTELGMELDGKGTVEGAWVDQVVGLDDVSSDIAMMRTPDGHNRIELTQFNHPAAVDVDPKAPANVHGVGRIMFAVSDIDDTIARLRTHGATVEREVVNYENVYKLCYLRGPEGILLALAEPLT